MEVLQRCSRRARCPLDLVTTLQRSFLHITLPPPDLSLLIAIPPSPPSPSSTVSSGFLILPSRLLPGTTQKQVINKGQEFFQILTLIDDSGLTSSVFVQFTRLVLCSCGHSGWRPWILFSATISPSTVRDLRGFGGILSRVPPLGILCKVSVCVSVWLCLFLCRCLCPGHPRQ